MDRQCIEFQKNKAVILAHVTCRLRFELPAHEFGCKLFCIYNEIIYKHCFLSSCGIKYFYLLVTAVVRYDLQKSCCHFLRWFQICRDICMYVYISVYIYSELHYTMPSFLVLILESLVYSSQDPSSDLSKMTEKYFDQQFHKFTLDLFSNILVNVSFHLISQSLPFPIKIKQKQLTFYQSDYAPETLEIALHALSYLL